MFNKRLFNKKTRLHVYFNFYKDSELVYDYININDWLDSNKTLDDYLVEFIFYKYETILSIDDVELEESVWYSLRSFFDDTDYDE